VFIITPPTGLIVTVLLGGLIVTLPLPPLGLIVTAAVGLNVTVELAVKVVNAPVEAVVLPIGPGLENLFVKPVPLTVELALNVVNAPVLGVVAPTVPLCGPLNPVAVNKPVDALNVNLLALA
jgi:hypothetical protein